MFLQTDHRGEDAEVQGGGDPLQPHGGRRGQDIKVQQVIGLQHDLKISYPPPKKKKNLPAPQPC